MTGEPVAPDTRVIVDTPPPGKRFTPVVLLTEGRAPETLLLWISLFMGLAIVNAMLTWGPALLNLSGLSVSVAALILAGNNFGSLGGHIIAGRLIDRFGPYGVIAASFCGAALCFVGTASLPMAIGKGLGMFGAGYCMGSVIAGINALAAILYPTSIRATGIGIATGVGRTGAVLSPIITATLLGAGWNPLTLFYTAVVPCGLGATAILFLGSRQKLGLRRAAQANISGSI